MSLSKGMCKGETRLSKGIFLLRVANKIRATGNSLPVCNFHRHLEGLHPVILSFYGNGQPPGIT